jgi:hypothetical protein
MSSSFRESVEIVPLRWNLRDSRVGASTFATGTANGSSVRGRQHVMASSYRVTTRQGGERQPARANAPLLPQSKVLSAELGGSARDFRSNNIAFWLTFSLLMVVALVFLYDLYP